MKKAVAAFAVLLLIGAIALAAGPHIRADILDITGALNVLGSATVSLPNGSVAIGSLTAGSNGQCATTSGSAAIWGSCAGSGGVQLLNVDTSTVSVNGNTTGNQNLKAYTFTGGTLNLAGKTFEIRTAGNFTPVNTSETIGFQWQLGGGTLANIQFVPSSTTIHRFVMDLVCSTITTGSSGTMTCSTYFSESVNSTSEAYSAAGEIDATIVNLTTNLTAQALISFSTASTSNTASNTPLRTFLDN